MTLHQAYYRYTLKQTQSLQWIYGYALTTVSVTLILFFDHLQTVVCCSLFFLKYMLILNFPIHKLYGSHFLFFKEFFTITTRIDHRPKMSQYIFFFTFPNSPHEPTTYTVWFIWIFMCLFGFCLCCDALFFRLNLHKTTGHFTPCFECFVCRSIVQFTCFTDIFMSF